MDKFKLTTEIKTTIKWDKPTLKKAEREEFEEKIAEIAEFINENLADVILKALDV